MIHITSLLDSMKSYEISYICNFSFKCIAQCILNSGAISISATI